LHLSLPHFAVFLQRREDLVDDWQTNHTQRENRLKEIDSMQERKFAELNKREADLAAEEQKFKISEKELKEREARLQVALSRVSNSEQTVAALEDKLNNYELTLKKRENDSDIRDRELASRRKEMESWDVLLREKDRKISVEQRNLDEREATVRATEEKVRQRDIDSERRLVDLRQAEGSVAEQAEVLKRQLAEVEARNTETLREQAESKALKEQLDAQHAEQERRQKTLDELQVRMSGIEQRERELNQRIAHHQAVEDEFFNVKVAQITARHGKELARLEQTIAQQLKIAADYQREMQQMRQDLNQKCAQIEEFQVGSNAGYIHSEPAITCVC
jgi:chromosome segregation ATPase